MNNSEKMCHYLQGLLIVFLALIVVSGFTWLPGMASSAQSTDQTTMGGQEPDGHRFEASKKASRGFIRTGEGMKYTIFLRNMTQETTQVAVTDPLPEGLTFVEGSVTAGGIYDTENRKLTWSEINVAPGSQVSLTFSVTASMAVSNPTPLINVATISTTQYAFQRMAWTFLLPGQPEQHPDLAGSYKEASRHFLDANQVVSYTIHLRNCGEISTTATVTDPLSESLAYIDGSLTGGGSYNDVTRTFTWENVAVPAQGEVKLSFAAMPAISVTYPTQVMNKVTIVSEGTILNRQVGVTLMPGWPQPRPNLAGSHKDPSRHKVSYGDVLTYTIRLHNSGMGDANVTVTDPLPDEMSYIERSANAGGVYSPSIHTLTWSGIQVAHGWSGTPLTYQMTPAISVTQPTMITNTAVISAGQVVLERTAHVKLMPSHPSGDQQHPIVESLTIGDQDVTSSPTVTLHISATDNTAVTWMYLREWYIETYPKPHWKATTSSGWIPFQAEYPWQLSNHSGVHYVGVWVADEAHNRSPLGRQAVDYISLVLPDTTIPKYGMVPYLVYYPAGVGVQVVVTPTAGDVDLFAWYPGNALQPDQKSTQTGLISETLAFSTTQAGTYVFLVYGSDQPSTYTISITPPGGPRVVFTPTLSLFGSITDASPGETMENNGLSWEPVFSQSGLDPLAEVEEPVDQNYMLYLPRIQR